jgi:hypothetical protein
MAKKPTERMLYEIYLDLWYASHIAKEQADELAEDLRGARQTVRKTDALLKKATENYKTVYGKDPLKPRGK